MRALTVTPRKANSFGLENIGPPPISDGAVLVRMLDLGICGTDIEIIKGNYGWAPLGTDRLIIGHESLGVVERAPSGCGFARGDFVAGIVRRPDRHRVRLAPSVNGTCVVTVVIRNAASSNETVTDQSGFA